MYTLYNIKLQKYYKINSISPENHKKSHIVFVNKTPIYLFWLSDALLYLHILKHLLALHILQQSPARSQSNTQKLQFFCQ